MDTKKTKIILDKINVLYKNITKSSNGPSALEQDLLLGYVRELYESILQDTPSNPETHSPKPSFSTPPLEIVQPKPEKKPTPSPILEIEDDEEDVVVPPPPPIVQAPKPEPPKEKVQAKVVKPLVPKPVKSASTNFDQLFEHKKATELSEKLSERPIPDLTRSMSINDKLLYVNELFGRDIEAFNETLKVLNRFESLDTAKGLLTNLAERYDWLNNEKINIARDFIKLTRRRYL